ncbi:MAG: pilus assembly protein PilM [bacterium]|jgi:Tfp pilus assembly PilM family ATPase/Tfp pilus assembly protein PilN|nr:pilus assembly protein PilM [bacterium]
MLRNRTSLGIDIEGERIRIVELRLCAGGYEIVHAACLDLGEDDISTALRCFIFEAGITPGRIVYGLPTEACVLKLVKLPKAAKAELAGMVRYEAELQMPLPLADMAWGYGICNCPIMEAGYLPVLIAGIKHEAADEAVAMAEAAHLTPDMVTFAIAAAARSVGNAAESVMILDMRREWISIGIAWQGSIVHVSNVRRDNERDDTEGAWLNKTAAEMKRSIFSLAASGSAVIPVKAVAVGEEASICEICRKLSELSEMEVMPSDPWHGMNMLATDMKEDISNPAAFAVATGLALMGLDGKGCINLLPGHKIEERTVRRRANIILSGLGTAALLLAFILMNGHGTLSARSAELQKTKMYLREIKRAIQEEGATEGIPSDKLRQQINDIRGRQKSSLELLRLLSLKMPPGIWLTELSYEKEKSLSIAGKGDSNSVIAAAVGRLSETALFDNVVLDYSNKERANAQAGYDFRITCSWIKKKGGLPVGKQTGNGQRTGITVQ